MWSGFWTERALLLTSGRAILRQRLNPGTQACQTLYDGADEGLSEVDVPRTHFGRPSLAAFIGPSACRFMAIDRPAGIIKEAEAHVLLLAHATRSLGLVAEDWRFCIDNRSRRQLLACAFPATHVELVQRWAARTRQHLSGIEPLYPCVSAAGKTSGVVVSEMDGVFAAARSHDGRFRFASVQASQGDLPLVTHRLSALGDGRGPTARFDLGGKSRGRPNVTFADLLWPA